MRYKALFVFFFLFIFFSPICNVILLPYYFLNFFLFYMRYKCSTILNIIVVLDFLFFFDLFCALKKLWKWN